MRLLRLPRRRELPSSTDSPRCCSSLLVPSPGCGGGMTTILRRAGAPCGAGPRTSPRPAGETLAELRTQVGEGGPVLAPSVPRAAARQEPLRLRPLQTARASRSRTRRWRSTWRRSAAARRSGPFLPATSRSRSSRSSRAADGLPTRTRRSRSTWPSSTFEKPGSYEVLGIARLDGQLVAATHAVPGAGRDEGRADPCRRSGERPAADPHADARPTVGGDLASIDTRVPPSSMHEADFADVLGKKPVVLLFATPALCQSRVCGPVVDVAEQVKASTGDDAEFIHMEIYNDNEIDRGFRPQVQRVQAADRAVAVHDRPQRQGRRADRGRLQRARARGGPGEGDRLAALPAVLP